MATRDVVLSNPTIVAAANRRDKYLFDTLGLNHDPFAFASAELELQANSEDPPFFSYFVDLPIQSNQGSLLETLKQPGDAIVYGAAGSGKTTFRYALEAQCRAHTEHILVVSQPVGKGEPNSNKSASIPVPSLSTFIEALATDLFVQTLEQFDTLSPLLDLELTTELSYFWHQHIPHFHRNVERHLHQEQPIHVSAGISIWWRTWKRHVIRYTPSTPARTQFLEQILALGKKTKKTTTLNPEALEQGGNLARQLGYRHIYYLIDVADNPQFNVQQLMEQFQDMASWSAIITNKIAFSLKVFLPERLKHVIENHPIGWPNPLISPSFSAIILWQDTQLLQTLIANRFRSAGSWIQGIEVLLSQEIATELPQKLIETAHHSPRRLLQIINLLINIHADREPDDPTILLEDWQQLCKSWSYDPPIPSPLMTNVCSTEGKNHGQRHL